MGLALALALAGVGCDRGAQGSEHPRPGADLAHGRTPDSIPGVQPGIRPEAVLGNVRNPYDGDRAAIATGRQLFVGMNCAGCHSGYAGGGMGPSLRDSLWIYGNSDAQLFSSIAEGRAEGMPAWGGRLPDEMIWRIVAYIRTLGTEAEPEKPPKSSGSRPREAPPPASTG